MHRGPPSWDHLDLLAGPRCQSHAPVPLEKSQPLETELRTHVDSHVTHINASRYCVGLGHDSLAIDRSAGFRHCFRGGARRGRTMERRGGG